jgi:hypothetical protein
VVDLHRLHLLVDEVIVEVRRRVGATTHDWEVRLLAALAVDELLAGPRRLADVVDEIIAL